MNGQGATSARPEGGWTWIFRISLLFKGADGGLEIIGGILLLLFKPLQLTSLIYWLTQGELNEDPKDVIANALISLGSSLQVSAVHFAAAYLLLHGVLKVALVWALLKGQLWAYPWMIFTLIFFVVYQSYQMALGFTWGMFGLTLLDLFIALLTYREFRHRKVATHTEVRHRQEFFGD